MSASKSSHAGSTHNPVVRWVSSVEQDRGLDGLVDRLKPVADALVADPARRDLLRGTWAGHALHPPLTDLPIGFWTSATMLDLFGGPRSRSAATRLVGLGILAALPTAVTGLAEWAGTGPEVRRVGVVHAAANSTALVLYTASWRARRKDRHRTGTVLALAGGAAAAVGGYLGGHLVSVRKVSSHNAGFDAR